MTLKIDDLTVTSFATEPVDATDAVLAPDTRGCPVGYTAAWTNCANTCITCAAGCQSGGGAVC